MCGWRIRITGFLVINGHLGPNTFVARDKERGKLLLVAWVAQIRLLFMDSTLFLLLSVSMYFHPFCFFSACIQLDLGQYWIRATLSANTFLLPFPSVGKQTLNFFCCLLWIIKRIWSGCVPPLLEFDCASLFNLMFLLCRYEIHSYFPLFGLIGKNSI